MADLKDYRLRCDKLEQTISRLQVLLDCTRDVLFNADAAAAHSREILGINTVDSTLPYHPSLHECIEAMSVQPLISDRMSAWLAACPLRSAAQIARGFTKERVTNGDYICGSYFECRHGLNCTNVNCDGKPHGCRYCAKELRWNNGKCTEGEAVHVAPKRQRDTYTVPQIPNAAETKLLHEEQQQQRQEQQEQRKRIRFGSKET